MIGHHGDSRSTSATDLDLESPERDASGKTYAEGTTPPSVAAAAHGTLKVDDVFGEIKENGPNYRDVRLPLLLLLLSPPPTSTAPSFDGDDDCVVLSYNLTAVNTVAEAGPIAG